VARRREGGGGAGGAGEVGQRCGRPRQQRDAGCGRRGGGIRCRPRPPLTPAGRGEAQRQPGCGEAGGGEGKER